VNQRYRRAIQLFAILVIIAIPFLNFYSAVYKSTSTYTELEGNMVGGHAHDVQSESLPSDQAIDPFVRMVFHAIEFATSWMEDPTELFALFKGGNWSIIFLGLEISDPLAFFGSTIASYHLETALLVSALIPIALAALAGPVWCGWLCPINTIEERVSGVRKKMQRYGLRPLDIELGRETKYAILFGTLAGSAVFGISVFPYVLPYVLLSREIFRLVFFHALGYGFLVIGAIAAANLLIWRRGFCRYLCPGGAMLSLIGSRRVLNVKRDSAKCISCELCSEVCEPGLAPYRDEIGIDCTNCGHCVSSCGGNALSYSLDLPTLKTRRAAKTAAVLWTATILAIATEVTL